MFVCWYAVFYSRLLILLILLLFLCPQLYDHRGETLTDFTHLETINIVFKPGFDAVVKALRQQLIHFIKTKIVFRGPFQG
jgi:hypothetical protein